MPTHVIFAAPFFMDATLRFIAGATQLPDTAVTLVSQDPAEKLPPDLRERLAGHWRVDDALDPRQLVAAAEALQARFGKAQSYIAALEQLQVPLAVVSSDVAEMENGGADLIATYRNLGALDLWGGDVVLQWFVTPEWTLSATYSHVSDNWFRIAGSVPLALNAPSNKGTLGIAYRNEGRGISASTRVRYTGSYPFLSTSFDGTACVPDQPAQPFQEACIEAYALVDATLGVRIPGTAGTLQFGVINLLDSAYRSFVGVPSVGRLAMVRLRYDLF